MKKEYIQPSFSIVRLQHRYHLLIVSNVDTSGDDVDLGYDKNGGNQGEAW